MNTRILTAAIIAGLFSGSAFAAGAGSEAKMGGQAQSGSLGTSFSELDTDQDGVVSRSEAAEQPQLIDSWDQADSNADGELDRTEFSAFEETGSVQPGTSDPGMPSEQMGDTYQPQP
ncbi:MAG: hypothetical protein RQ736_07660 [Thiogranum sp.]|nr:hypothetical protein [Thiogranum sp.]